VRNSLWMILLAAVLATGCDQVDKKPEALHARLEGNKVVFPPGAAQLETIKSEAAEAGKPATLRISGRLVWDEGKTVRVFPPFSGRVVRILANPGDTVKPGQALAVLASPEFGQAQAEARRGATDFALAEKNLARLRELHANGVAPRKDLQAAEADHARAQSELQRAQKKISLYGGNEAAVDQSFSLKSPIAGTVVERNINPGQELRSDLVLANAPAMFVITDPGRLWVQLDASESDLPHLKRGQTLRLHSSSYPEQSFAAKVDVVSDFIDPLTRVIRVRGSVDNRERTLKGEMFVTAEIDIGTKPGVQVSAKAVFLSGDKYFAFVEDAPGAYTRVEVKTGGTANGSIGVIAGLAPGQKVVVEGSLLLQRLSRELAGD
jgi:cobalt-zinc-cadmium efflux system membrane fusion protein